MDKMNVLEQGNVYSMSLMWPSHLLAQEKREHGKMCLNRYIS